MLGKGFSEILSGLPMCSCFPIIPRMCIGTSMVPYVYGSILIINHSLVPGTTSGIGIGAGAGAGAVAVAAAAARARAARGRAVTESATANASAIARRALFRCRTLTPPNPMPRVSSRRQLG